MILQFKTRTNKNSNNNSKYLLIDTDAEIYYTQEKIPFSCVDAGITISIDAYKELIWKLDNYYGFKDRT